MQVKLSSEDIGQFNNKLVSFISNLEKAVNVAVDDAGGVYVHKVRAEIGTHDPTRSASVYGKIWGALSKRWIESKEDSHGIREMWAETGGILNAVDVYYTDVTSTFAGIDSSRHEYAFKKAMNNEFGTLEYEDESTSYGSSDRVSTRPLFMPVANSMTEEFRSGTGVYRYFVDALKIAVRRTWAT